MLEIKELSNITRSSSLKTMLASLSAWFNLALKKLYGMSGAVKRMSFAVTRLATDTIIVHLSCVFLLVPLTNYIQVPAQSYLLAVIYT